MTREEILKALRPIEWKEAMGIVRTTYITEEFIDGRAFITEAHSNWITSFDTEIYASLSEAKQAADEYRKTKILSHFNLEEE